MIYLIRILEGQVEIFKLHKISSFFSSLVPYESKMLNFNRFRTFAKTKKCVLLYNNNIPETFTS